MKRVDSQIVGFDHEFDLGRFGHDRNGCRAGVNAALCFGFGNPLHAMSATFELQFVKGTCTGNRDDDLLEAFGIDKAERLRKGFAGRNGQGRIDRMRTLFRRAQRRMEKKHFKDRARLMRYEKQRNEMQTNMGLDPFLDSTQ